jgi:MFS family permease
MTYNEKKQLWTFLILSSLLSLVISGLEVLFTVYAINEVQVDAAEWSQIRSLRYFLTMVVVFLLGIYASHLGSKRTTMFAIFMCLLPLLFTIWFPSKSMLYMMYPLYGALSQTLLVNMNVMAQETSGDMRELTNTLYRSTFIAFSMLGPVASTYWISGGYSDAFLLFTFILVPCLALLTLYPARSPQSRLDKLNFNKMKEMIGQWGKLCSNRTILLFVILVGLINQAFQINMTLMPIKLMSGMGLSDQNYSILVTFHSVFGLVFVLSLGFLLKRYLNLMIVVPYVCCSLGHVLMGMISDPQFIIIIFIMSNALFQITMAPMSIWLSQQVAESELSTAFSFAKISSSLQGVLATMILAIIQPLLGINSSLIIYGLGGLACCILLSLFLKKADKSQINVKLL